MVRIFLSAVTSIILLLPTLAAPATTITVTFAYPPDQNVNIIGFRLMRDGSLDTDNILPTVREFTTAGPDDANDHTYTLIAVGKNGQLAESNPYVFRQAPPIAKPSYLKVTKK